MKNIQAMTKYILESGYTEARMAEETLTSQTVIHQLKTGALKDTKYERGLRIAALYSKVVARNKRLAKAGSN